MKRRTRRGLHVHYPNLKIHVHSLLVIGRGVEVQGYKEVMCPHGGIKALGMCLVCTLVVT